MLSGREILLVICCVGAIQSLFWGVDFLFFFDRKGLSSRLLGGLFIVVGARVLKSTLYIFTADVHLIIINIGFAAHYAIGPFLLLYVMSLKEGYRFKRTQSLHFLPALLILILSPVLGLDDFWYRGGYSALLIQTIVYEVLAVWYLFKTRAQVPQAQRQWATILAAGLAAFLFAYFSNYQLRLNPYLYAPVIYSVVIYLLSFYLIKNRNKIFHPGAKYRNINISSELAAGYKEKVIQFYLTQKPFLDNAYSLSQLSKDVRIPKHVLSHLFSSQMQMGFVDFNNYHRIEVAKTKLLDDQHVKIASVAYDCGFNSLSAFNQAFKKFSRITPSRFRENTDSS